MEEKDLSESLENGREPVNGNDCFFRESTFLGVMGPGPTFEERLHSLSSRPKNKEHVKKKIPLDIDLSVFKAITEKMKEKKLSTLSKEAKKWKMRGETSNKSILLNEVLTIKDMDGVGDVGDSKTSSNEVINLLSEDASHELSVKTNGKSCHETGQNSDSLNNSTVEMRVTNDEEDSEESLNATDKNVSNGDPSSSKSAENEMMAVTPASPNGAEEFPDATNENVSNGDPSSSKSAENEMMAVTPASPNGAEEFPDATNENVSNGDPSNSKSAENEMMAMTPASPNGVGEFPDVTNENVSNGDPSNSKSASKKLTEVMLVIPTSPISAEESTVATNENVSSADTSYSKSTSNEMTMMTPASPNSEESLNATNENVSSSKSAENEMMAVTPASPNGAEEFPDATNKNVSNADTSYSKSTSNEMTMMTPASPNSEEYLNATNENLSIADISYSKSAENEMRAMTPASPNGAEEFPDATNENVSNGDPSNLKSASKKLTEVMLVIPTSPISAEESTVATNENISSTDTSYSKSTSNEMMAVTPASPISAKESTHATNTNVSNADPSNSNSASDEMTTVAPTSPHSADESFCLVLPNQSSDDDDDDMEQFIKQQADYKHLSVDKQKPVCAKKTEESFALVLPGSSSSNEQSDMDDVTDFSKLQQTAKFSQEIKHTETVCDGRDQSNNPEILATKQESPERKSTNTIVPPDKILETDMSGRSIPVSDDARSVGNLNVESPQETCPSVNNIQNINETLIAEHTGLCDPPVGNEGKKKDDSVKVYYNERSNLNKREHKRYIQLYRKYVIPMMKGTKKNVYSEAELRELVELEELQQRVSQEQLVYQDYLKNKANRNPNAYNFLKSDHRIYSNMRYNSYHKGRFYIRNYETNGFMELPLVWEDREATAFMVFKKTLLKLGSSPTITLPDVKDGANPVSIDVTLENVNALFPSSNMKRDNFSVDHKMVSEDHNASILAQEEEVDVVLSSSSFKCLLDNHASDIMRPWDIPVSVRLKNGHKTIFLDKPLYRDDMPVRDYNALYHKYAFRAFVSRPRRQTGRINQARNIGQRKSAASDTKAPPNLRVTPVIADDFDMFSTEDVCDIDTFGSGSIKKTMSSASKLPFTSNFSKIDERGDIEMSDMSSFGKSSLKSEESISQYGNNSSAIALSTSDPISNPEPKSNTAPTAPCQISLRPRTRLSESLESRPETDSPNSSNPKLSLSTESDGPPIKIAKTDTDVSSQVVLESGPISPKRKRGRPRKDQSLLVESKPATKAVESLSDLVEKPKDLNMDAMNELHSPMSPCKDDQSPTYLPKDGPLSPTVNQSPKRKRGRPRKDQSLPEAESKSATKEMESSSELVEKSKDLNMDAMSDLYSPISPGKDDQGQTGLLKDIPLSPTFHQSQPQSDNKNFVNPLDSILGPSEAKQQTPMRKTEWSNIQEFDNGNEFLPVVERCNCVTYNLWELGSIRVLLRCNGHGTLKDKNKPRYVYLSPKMEYQRDYGMEQVTLSEMTRTWASCFIRPGTSLIRARINPFTSDILMLEEKPIDGILNPSLPFKPEHSFAVIRGLLEELTRLPKGQYVLSHCKGHKTCSVRKFHGHASVSKNKKKKTGQAKVGQVPWIPIDPTILTPNHIFNSRIPATFMPSDWVKINKTDGNDGKTPNHGGGHKGQNKNKNRNKNQNKNQNKGKWQKKTQN